VSKLIRSTEDALTDSGAWKDDALVVEYDRAAKVYIGEDPEALDAPGARIVVRLLALQVVAAIDSSAVGPWGPVDQHEDEEAQHG
jgi:hypothetical protein